MLSLVSDPVLSCATSMTLKNLQSFALGCLFATVPIEAVADVENR